MNGTPPPGTPGTWQYFSGPLLPAGVSWGMFWPGWWWVIAVVVVLALLRWAPAFGRPILLMVVLLVLLDAAAQGLFPKG